MFSSICNLFRQLSTPLMNVVNRLFLWRLAGTRLQFCKSRKGHRSHQDSSGVKSRIDSPLWDIYHFFGQTLYRVLTKKTLWAFFRVGSYQYFMVKAWKWELWWKAGEAEVWNRKICNGACELGFYFFEVQDLWIDDQISVSLSRAILNFNSGARHQIRKPCQETKTMFVNNKEKKS